MCHRRRLHSHHHYDVMMEQLYCPGAIKGHPAVVSLPNGRCPTCFEPVDSQCCLKRHVKQCRGRWTCTKCRQLVIARNSENLEEKVKQHICGLRKCLSCFEDIDASQRHSHCCKLAPKPFLRAFPSMSCWDIETWTLPSGQLRDLMIVLAYESRVSGTFHEVTFTHTGFQFPLSDTIRKHTYTSDYLPPEVGNVFDDSNLLKPRKKRKKAKGGNDSDQEDDPTLPEDPHVDLHAWVKAHKDDHAEILKDYSEYWKNLKRYSPIVSPDMRKRPIFKFLCFILSSRHANRRFLSHFGARFDSVYALAALLELQFKPKCLPQGLGVLSILVEEFNIELLDTYKFFGDKLENLPARFGLPEEKGFSAYSNCLPSNFNRVRR